MNQVINKPNRVVLVSRIAICAALYAVINGITAAIPTPFSIGQFRPGVIIPALFSIIFGTLVGSVGAALGSFIGDIIFLTPLGRTNPLLALVAGVPGNFVGFLVFGIIINRYKSWSWFMIDSLIALFIGNFIAGAGVVLIVFQISSTPLPFGLALGATLGYAFWWLFTMLPFMLLVLPLILRIFLRYENGKVLAREFLTWKEESIKHVALVSVLVSLPLFLIFMFSYTPYLSGAFAALGSLSDLIRYLILGSAVVLLLTPFAPKIAGVRS